MSKVSAVLRRVQGGYGHWCPGCEEMHVIYVDRPKTPKWSFDGNVEKPTFAPSIRITYNGSDAGQDRGDGFGKAPPACCHYFVRSGQIEFCGDSTHSHAGKTVPLPDLPDDAT